MLDYENAMNPFEARRTMIAKWRELATIDCESNEEIINISNKYNGIGIQKKDSIHIACAIFTKSDYLITTDKKLLNKSIDDIKIVNPIEFILRLDGEL